MNTMQGLIKKANFSRCRKYRYALRRHWDADRPVVLFVALNPSIADELNDDPTLKRCLSYARTWGYGGLSLGNLFAAVATDPNRIKSMEDPVGSENDLWLRRLASDAHLIVAAWGNGGTHLDRARHVSNMLYPLHCLKQNKSGQPVHPLYQLADLTPAQFVYPPRGT